MAYLRSLLKNEAFRYLIAGGWNSAFGILAFSVVWLLLHKAVGPWGLVAIAHIVATTQAFFIQRHLVFTRTGDSSIAEYAKFQLSYLALFVIGGSFVNALSSQGMHPIAAQTLGTVLLAACGYFLGKSFTFKAGAAHLPSFWRRAKAFAYEQRWAIVCFILCALLFEAFWGARFYANPNHIGHDFALTGTGLLEGKFWIDSNGLIGGLFNPPWFTPAWCAGTALYADPQSAFYSPIQFFAFAMDPIAATHASALLFAALGYWGCYALARRVFLWAIPPSVVFAILAAANAFLPLRSAVGEAGYQPLYLWPFLAIALCLKPYRTGPWGHLWPCVAACMALTGWIQFGFGGMLVPVILATLFLCLWLVWTERATLSRIAIRLCFGSLAALALNSSRLYENISLMRNFPRNFYDLPGFANLSDAFAALAFSLFQPSEWTAFFGDRKLQKVMFTALPHEWCFEFGLGALVLCVACFALWACFKPKGFAPRPKRSAQSWIALAGMALIFAIPPLLLWDNGALRGILKQIPILNSAAWPMRWAVLYLPMAQMMIAGSVGLFLATFPRFPVSLALIASLGAIWAGPATEPLSYYLGSEFQAYNPTPVYKAFEKSRLHGPIPITAVGVAPKGQWYGNRNDTMLSGVSQGACYNPIYGYRLEAFPQLDRLTNGPALSAAPGQSQTRLSNPACLVHPKENGCAPGDGFVSENADQMALAGAFIDRKPLAWKRPVMGQILAYLSQTMFWILFALCVMRLWQMLLYSMRPARALSTAPAAALSKDSNESE